MNENNSGIKINSKRNSIENFSFNDKSEKNLSINFDEKIFALNYNYTSKYKRKKNRDKFHF